MVDLDKVEERKVKTYDRNVFADTKAMSDYKKNHFSGRQTTEDEYTGKKIRLHSEKESCLANTDHIKPLKKGFEEVRYNYFVSDEQLKEALNDATNFAITNGSLNKSKRDKTNNQYIEKHGDLDTETRERMQNLGKKANQEFDKKIRKATVITATEYAKEGAIHSAKSGATQATMRNVMEIAEGEKELDEAIVDIVCTSLKTSVEGACSDVSQVALIGGREKFLSVIEDPKCKEQIQRVFKNENLGLIVAVATNAASLTVKALNGDISVDEYKDQLLDTSVNLAIFYQLAMLAAPYGVVAGIVTNFLATKILESVDKWLEKDRNRQMRIDNYRKMQEMAKYEGDRIENILKQARENYDQDTKEAMDKVKCAFQTGDNKYYELGIQSLSKCYGFDLAIKSDEDMLKFLQSDLGCLKLGEYVEITY